MVLQKLEFSFAAQPGFQELPIEWSHTGVVGSGDMEVLLTRAALEGGVRAVVNTPVQGFDDIWQRVLARFVAEAKPGNLQIEINDNNATPFIVALRLKQAFAEALEGGRV